MRCKHLVSTARNKLRIFVTSGFLLLFADCSAPTERRWEMTFLTPGSEAVVVRIATSDLFAGRSRPTILRTLESSRDDHNALTSIGSSYHSTQRRVIGDATLVAGPPCSGYFRVRNEATDKIIGGARAGHSYSSLWGMSPCGEYLAYFVPGTFWRRSYVHHVKSDRRALISIPAAWRLNSWTQCDGAPGGPGAVGTEATTQSLVRHEGPIISLLGRRLMPVSAGPSRKELEDDLLAARAALEEDPDDPSKIVWVGRRLGYLWRINDAIEVYTEGITEFPDYAPFYRHRGHRLISARRFHEAIVDLERATRLIEGKPDEIEQDGAPNDRGIPLTTTAFNIWYHLGLARYLTGDFNGAFVAFGEAQKFGSGYDDNLVATTDWMYMALRRLGRDYEAVALLKPISPDMEMIENTAYHRRTLMYKGLLTPDELLDLDSASDLDVATLGYGLGTWYLYNGKPDRAVEIFRRVIAGPYWPAFGYIAAEVELARLAD